VKHRILTCKNHPDLRWSVKEIAWSGGDDGAYNGARNLHFMGVPSGRGMFTDGSGLDCDRIIDNKFVPECPCPLDDLVIAPEDKLVIERG